VALCRSVCSKEFDKEFDISISLIFINGEDPYLFRTYYPFVLSIHILNIAFHYFFLNKWRGDLLPIEERNSLLLEA